MTEPHDAPTNPLEIPRTPVSAPAPDPAAFERDRRRNTVDQLLRRPEALLERLDGADPKRALWVLFLIACGGHLVYGLVLGSFAGGPQWWASPLKTVMGALLCGAICFPSLYIFVSLSGAEARAHHVLAMLLGLLASTGIFLAGFAPVAWVFSQSSTTVALIAPIHLLLWIASLLASQRILSIGLRRWSARRGSLTGLWVLILVVTCLQMMTTLRPLIGMGTRLFEPQRKFFLVHWVDTLQESTRRTQH